MKKIFSGIFVLLLLVCCGIFYGCDGRYTNLTFFVALDYNKNAENVEQLDSLDYRITTENGAFDDHLDGSYTFYIKDSYETTAKLKAVFSNEPGDFNYGVSFSISNEIINVGSNYKFEEHGVSVDVSAFKPGSTVLTIFSNEGNKKTSVLINVVKIANNIRFTNNQMAIVNKQGSTLTLNQNEDLNISPNQSSVTKINYEIGQFQEDEFVPYSTNELLNIGLRFTKSNLTFSVIKENLSINDFYIRAIYDNPLGDDLTAITKIKVVKCVSDFELYYGKNNSDITNENLLFKKVSSGEQNINLKNLIINIEDLNFTEIILKVKSNGELVDFNYVIDDNLPVYFMKNGEVEFLKEDCKTDATYDSQTKSYYANATYTVYYFKVIASKKTTENDLYPLGYFTISLICDYANYDVDNYPLVAQFNVKNDALIRNFAINNQIVENESIIDNHNMTGYYSTEIYINNYFKSDSISKGTSVKIDVGNPISILSDNAKYRLSLYDSNFEPVDDVLNYFKIQKFIGNSININNITDNFASAYDKNTTFNFIANTVSGYLSIGQTYYLIVTAEKPEEETKQAKATIKFSIVQGVKEFTSYSYSYGCYDVDESTGEYKLDINGDKIELTCSANERPFDSYVGVDTINLDLESGFDATILLNYLPNGANLNNLIITSSDESIFVVEKDSEYLNKFYIKTKDVGQGFVSITTTNIDDVYEININVYRPITNFCVKLASAFSSSGVGSYTQSEDNLNVLSAEIKIGKNIQFILSTLPTTASQFSMKYVVFRGNVEDDIKVGEYFVNYKGKASSTNSIISNEDFQFDCVRHSFVFIKDEAATKVYTVVFSLINLDNSIISRQVLLKAYVPVESIDAEISRFDLYNPNTITYSQKTSDSNDPTAFSVKVETNKKSGRVATYNFNNYGKINVIVNGEIENIFNLVNGILVPTNLNSLILCVNDYATEGYYWFKLNDSYNYSSIKPTIFISAQINELGYYYSTSSALRINTAERIKSLVTSQDELIYFKHGITQPKQVDIQELNETVYNKNLLVKTFDIITINNDDLYFEESEDISVVNNLEFFKTSKSTLFNLNIASNNVGYSVVIIMPEDKIIYKTDYDKWFEKTYIPVSISSDDFVAGRFYLLDGEIPEDEYVEGEQYYVLSCNLDDCLNLWKKCLVFYVSVADGIKIPYQISTYEDLIDISNSSDSVQKKYVLTNNIIVDSSIVWNPIGNFYLEKNVNEDNFDDGTYYSSSIGNQVAKKYIESNEYYAFGFNGELNGKYSYKNIKTNVTISNSYKINNLICSDDIENGCFGFFANLGYNAKISNLTLSYASFQPIINGTTFICGGVCANNYGTITDTQISFNDFNFITVSETYFGGIAGINYGFIKNDNLSLTGLNGKINIGIGGVEDNVYVGGLIGKNNKELKGSYLTDISEVEYTFNDAGFDSSLNINVFAVAELGSGHDSYELTAVGGAIGENEGKISNISVQGSVHAEKCNNVGGLVGIAKYNRDYNGEGKYSISSSFSTASVKGYSTVGGAIGFIDGNNTNLVRIYYVSAENYVTDTNYSRIFIQGHSNVGGLVGCAKGAYITYSYVVSYFDIYLDEDNYSDEDREKTSNYDLVADGDNVGGFAGFAENVVISFVAVNANLYDLSDSDSFDVFIGGQSTGVSSEDICVVGSIYYDATMINNITYNFSSVKNNAFYYFYIFDLGHLNNFSSLGGDFLTNGSKSDLNDDWDWDKANGGLPYIVIQELNQPLFATNPINVNAEVKANSNYESYINGYESNEVILFLNFDETGEQKQEDINLLNLIKLTDFVNLTVEPKTSKSTRLNVSTTSSKIVSVSNDGTLKVLSEGKVAIKISSKLNSNFQATIYIVVKYGVNDVSLYYDVVHTNKLNAVWFSILKSDNKTLYSESEYIRDLAHEEDVQLKSCNDVGTRFYVDNDENLQEVLLDSECATINDLFKMNGYAWRFDAELNSYYVDIEAGVNPVITPIKTMSNYDIPQKIKYTPYIKANFQYNDEIVLLNKFSAWFLLSIVKGATDIIIENNINYVSEKYAISYFEESDIKNYKVEMSQIQTYTFTVTLFTDYELDAINDNVSLVNSSSMLTVVKGDVVSKFKQVGLSNILESISLTYTISYKDKINAVENDLTYSFVFSALSNAKILLKLTLVIQGQDKINQVYGTVYASLDDFPQEPEKNDIIYNANVGVLSVEVYPYFSNYSKMRIYYTSTTSYPLLITQLSYDITGESGSLLTDYIDSGSISSRDEVMLIEKSSGQDSYLLNTLGVYSYSKMYFFSLLPSTAVPDDTQFNIYVEFLNRKNNVIETFVYSFKTIAKPSIKFEFDKKLKSVDDIYYLPLNTENTFSVELVNYEGDIDWKIESEYDLNQNEIDALIPTKNSDGTYTLRVLKYSPGGMDNSFTIDILGKKFRLTGIIVDNQRSYSCTVDFVASFFTVTAVYAQNTSNGYMTLPLSTTSPLTVKVDCYYDNALVDSEDNWYSDWYNSEAGYNQGKNTSSILYKYLFACGYEIEEYFSNYIVQLSNAIAKASPDNNNVGISKTSGVWFYNSSEGDSGYLQSEYSYNDTTFAVEIYNEYFALYGYQIDKHSNLSLKVNVSYMCNETNPAKIDECKKVNGIPNVYNYDVSLSTSTYNKAFELNDDFILTFVYKSDLINAIPVSSAKEFLEMKEGFDYRLINDIILSDYIPLDTAISTFDGNNYNIYITSFGYKELTEEEYNFGLFGELSENTILYNVKVCYTGKVNEINGDLSPGVAPLSLTIQQDARIKFGGIAAVNNGTLTNCQVSGGLTFNTDLTAQQVSNALNGGLVGENSTNGFITNSKVFNFDLTTYGKSGGFVGNNNGKVVASYFEESSLNNISSENTGGFVYYNTGDIHECYVQGYRSQSDNDIRNTGVGVVSKGSIGGFAYSNESTISDCYSNISLNSSRYLAGFVYSETSTSVISRCYSISYKSVTDNSRVASPFAGANSVDFTEIAINGTLNNCFYCNAGAWSEISWGSSVVNKKASGLSLDEFATHTNFVNYDLSLTANTGEYADEETQYSYVDGYTWVIIEGKPLIVSTLIDTVSQRDYVGKSKNYSASATYYETQNYSNLSNVSATISADKKVKTFYYGINVDGKRVLLYTTILDSEKKTLTYTFEPNDTRCSENVMSDKFLNDVLTLIYTELEIEGGVITSKKLSSAEYGTGENLKILDAREYLGVKYVDDKNYRANDTVEITYDENGEISKILYKVLENASYYYNSNAKGISEVVGARTNPQIIYDYESFAYYLVENTAGNYYRMIRDIDFNYNFTPTAYADFQGAFQGNYMNIDKLSISFLNNSSQMKLNNSDSFGLFSAVSTVNSDAIVNFDTVISNLYINIIEVLSNTHAYVGALAGEIKAQNLLSSRKIILNNIIVKGYSENPAYVQGKNAVGGLAGKVSGNVIIKDINCSVNVNATKEVKNGEVAKMFYVPKTSEQTDKVYMNSVIGNIAYAGGVIGIFDANKVNDLSTQKNYNANNIKISGDINIIGSIVGSAFGFIGENTTVNYVNTTVSGTENNYLKAISYAGGLVGENRGKIISSSISYGSLESYANVKPGSSTIINENDYFYNGSDSPIAIGGIVGFNNGGTISNCSSTVDVRHKNATVAGGAVGRLSVGRLENVIASGSVYAKVVIGGLIGTINDIKILQDAGYSTGLVISEDTLTTYIENCVAENNWLVKDYSYYIHMSRIAHPVGGFIGLIAAEDYDFIAYRGKNYFSNTLYTTVSTSGLPTSYLKVAYKSNSFDIITDYTNAPIHVLNDASGDQVVFPYSTREFYYEDTYIGPYYKIEAKVNSSYMNESATNPYERIIYTVKSYGGGLTNINDLYEAIDLSNDEIWTQKPITLTEYNQHFGAIYFKNGDSFVKIQDRQTFNNKVADSATFYYIPDPELKSYEMTKSYVPDKNSSIVINIESGERENDYDYVFQNKEDFNKISSVYVNGIAIENLESADHEKIVQGEEYIYKYNNLNVVLPNSSKITCLKIVVGDVKVTTDSAVIDSFGVTSLELTFKYEINDGKGFINTTKTKVTNTEYTYYLSVASKKVIFDNYLNSGYWKVDNEKFLLNATYNKAEKYLQNIEFADKYLWNSFTITDEDGNESLDSIADATYANTYNVTSAEELATVSKLVNKGSLGSNINIRIKNNIDLSGKYWVPIGTESEKFKGYVDGGNYVNVTSSNYDSSRIGLYSIDSYGRYFEINQSDYGKTFSVLSSLYPQGLFYLESCYSIKYPTVNVDSAIDKDGNQVNHSGLFGYVESSIIANLIVTGGDIYGKIAGGVVGYAKDSSIKNIINRNNVSAVVIGGGICGQALNTSIENCVSYGAVVYKNSGSDLDIRFGGIVGSAEGNFNFANNKNVGNIDIFNTKTNYAGSGNKVEIYVGGIVGYINISQNIDVENINEGDISITTNAHSLYAGGICGYLKTDFNLTEVQSRAVVISRFKNFGDIDISINNIYIVPENAENPVFIKDVSMVCCGGVVGFTETNLSLCGNEGQIICNYNTTADAWIAFGGVAGVSNGKIEKSYNTNDIEITAISSKTVLGFGGICGFNDLTRYGTEISNCYNVGDLKTSSGCYAFVGGIVGNGITRETNPEIAPGRVYYYEGYVGTQMIVSKCLNIGDVNIIGIIQTHNALGSIIGYNYDQVVLNGNYYLRGSAFSGVNVYNAYSITNIETSDTYYQSIPSELEVGCNAEISTTLKDEYTYTNAFLDVNDMWSFSGDNPVWNQTYDTWYPTLKDNPSASFWIEKQEDITQEKGYYIVNSAEQLAYISAKINSGEIESSSITIKITNYIDLSNRFWTPIGTELYPFKGTFDGNGFIIKNMTIDGGSEYGSLFGYILNANICNFGIENPIIKNVDYAAALAFNAENCVISKIYSNCADNLGALDDIVSNLEVSSPVISGRLGAGGIVYSTVNCKPLVSNSYKGGIYYCYNDTPVRTLGGSIEEGTVLVGGLVGNMTTTLISNSYNNCNGIIFTANQLEGEEGYNNGLLIAGRVDNDSDIFNVFNLSNSIYDYSSNNYICNPRLFKFTKRTSEEYGLISATELEPTYANLSESDNVEKSSIWTQENEYSLNETQEYPSLRGLGGEWKNTESEALITINENNYSQSAVDNVLKTLGLLDEDEQATTLVCSYKPQSTLVQIDKKVYYFISSEEELAWVSTNVNSGNLLTYNNEFILLKDLDLSKKYWTPIGTTTYPFQGIFNFNGHTIKNLIIDSDYLNYAGLFGYTNGAQIVNGYLENVFIKIRSIDPKLNIYVGGLVGSSYNTTIQNISVSSTIAAYSNASAFVGGVVGSYRGTQSYSMSNVRIERYSLSGSNIYKYIDISEYQNQVIEIKTDNAKIKEETISIGGFSSGGNVYVGGIAGYISGYGMAEVDDDENYLMNAIYSNTNVASISISDFSNVYAGGAIGYALEEVKLNDISVDGYVKTFTNQSDIIGGVVGYINNGNLTNASFNGYIECCQDFDNHIWSYIGGIVGYMRSGGHIQFCINSGEINPGNTSYNYASVGGILGYSLDRYLTDDKKCFYPKNDDYGAIGYDSSSAESTVVAEKFSSEGVNWTDFDEDYWNLHSGSDALKSEMIFLKGCGEESFNISSVDGDSSSNIALSTEGKLVYSMASVFLRRGSGSWHISSVSGETQDYIGIAVVDKNGNYKYEVLKIENDDVDGENINLMTFINKIEDIDVSQLITCFVTLIQEEVV